MNAPFVRTNHRARACAIRQGQNLALLACEPCHCDAAKLRRCESEKRLDDFLLEMGSHAEQVERLHGAATDLMQRLERWPDLPSPWTIAGGDKLSVRRDRWRQWRFRTPYTKLASEKDISAAFVAILYLADDLDAVHSRQHPRLVIPLCDAPTLSGRAYQAACHCLTAFYDLECTGFRYINPSVDGGDIGHFIKAAFGIEPSHRGFPVLDISAARIVAEIFDAQMLRHVRRGLPDYFIAMYTLDRSTDLRQSISAAARILGRDESSIRERYDRLLGRIEQALGKYCKSYNYLAYTPKSVGPRCYNIGIRTVAVANRLVEPKLLPEPQPFALPDKVAQAELRLLAWAQGHARKTLNILPTQCPPGLARHYFSGAMKPDVVRAPEGPTFTIDSLRQHPAPPYGEEPVVIYNPMQAVHLGSDETDTQYDDHVRFAKHERRGDLRLDPAKDFRWPSKAHKRWYVERTKQTEPVIRNDVVELTESLRGDAPGADIDDPEEQSPFFED
jgi:hypothetical protein